jgi:response regulator RpfG family c-di-GMP phosphodiesterase
MAMPKQYKFLLVDDSLLDLFIHKKMIAISNIAESITTFNSAEEALEYLQENDSNMEESIMLLDLQMPGMNGFKFIEVFATLSDNIKNALRIFILSSTVDQGDIKLAKENPYIEDMISKPVDVNALKIKLEAERN